MRKHIIISIVILMGVCAAAHAGTYQFVPNPAQLQNLEHQYAYQWTFNWTTTETITGASLHFSNITNWSEPENDRLGVYLLQNKNTAKFLNTSWQLLGSNSYSQAYRWYDSQNTGKPFNYATWPTVKNQIMYPQIPTYPADGFWRDTNGANTISNIDFVFDVQDVVDLAAWSADGNWALGIDPDCHYWNSGITLTINTRATPQNPIPEPMSLVLGAVGMGCMSALRRLRRR